MKLLFMGGSLILLGVLAAAVAAEPSVEPAQGSQPQGITPPQVTWRYPGFLGPQTDSIQEAAVEFSVSVKGVRATDLSVNGSHATELEVVNAAGSDTRYVFRGFASPPLGWVKIELASGEIVRDPSGVPFEGHAWKVELLDPAVDEDGDGLSNSAELKLYTNPRAADTDGDGLPDSYEAEHACLNPIQDEAFWMDYMGQKHAASDDTDGDGVSNSDEFKKQTDPCTP